MYKSECYVCCPNVNKVSLLLFVLPLTTRFNSSSELVVLICFLALKFAICEFGHHVQARDPKVATSGVANIAKISAIN